MFILTENNRLVNSRNIVSIYVLEEGQQFGIFFDCSRYNELDGSEQNFEVHGNRYMFKKFKTREEAETALRSLQIPLNVNEA